MTLRILSGKGEVQIMSFRKLSGKCHFLLRFCTRNWSETYVYSIIDIEGAGLSQLIDSSRYKNDYWVEDMCTMNKTQYYKMALVSLSVWESKEIWISEEFLGKDVFKFAEKVDLSQISLLEIILIRTCKFIGDVRKLVKLRFWLILDAFIGVYVILSKWLRWCCASFVFLSWFIHV